MNHVRGELKVKQITEYDIYSGKATVLLCEMIRCKLPICIHMILAHGIDIQDVQVVSTLMQFGTKKTVESFLTDLQLNPAFVDSEIGQGLVCLALSFNNFEAVHVLLSHAPPLNFYCHFTLENEIFLAVRSYCDYFNRQRDAFFMPQLVKNLKPEPSPLLDIIRSLLVHGANPCQVNQYGETVLMLAVRSVYLSVELVKILLPHLSVEVINAKDENGKSALSNLLNPIKPVSAKASTNDHDLTQEILLPLLLSYGAEYPI